MPTEPDEPNPEQVTQAPPAQPEAAPKPVMSPAEARAWMARVSGAGVAFFVAAINFVAVIANIDTIRQFVWNRLGLFGSEDLYLISVLLAFGALVIYAFVSALAYYFFVRERPRLFKLGYWALVIAITPAIAYFTFSEFGPAPAAAKLDEQVAELQQITLDQWTAIPPDRGAFRFSLTLQTEAPQAWTSAQALAALLASPEPLSAQQADIARRTLNYLAAVRTADGWGFQDGNARGITEIAGWIVVAEVMSLDPHHAQRIWPEQRERDAAVAAVFDHLRYLVRRQHDDGGWGPIGKTANPAHERTYSSIMAMTALLEAQRLPLIADDRRWSYDAEIRRGVRWLLREFEPGSEGQAGWFPNPSLPRQTGECLGLTAQGLYVLELAQGAYITGSDPDLQRVRAAFFDQALNGARGVAGAAGVADRDFHFNCRVHDTDIYLPNVPNFQLEPSTYLWYPWSLAAVGAMQSDPGLTEPERNMARTLSLMLAQRMEDATRSARGDQALYVVAETLYGANITLRSRARAAAN